jgi:hypothetical protein
MTATRYSETLAFIYQITRHNIPEDSDLKFLMFGGDLFYFLFNEVNSTEQAAHVAVGE